MKITVKIICLALLLPIYSFSAPITNPEIVSRVYNIEQSVSLPNTLIVKVNRATTLLPTKLILIGSAMGITSQVQDVRCDERVIKQVKRGVWLIPGDCRKLHWQVPLLASGTALAAKQQSIKSGNFILFSTVSSLPRLQDAAASEVLKINISDVKSILPKPNSLGYIPLPSTAKAPLFVLLNASTVGTKTVGSIRLAYFLDNPDAVHALPNMASHMKGLQWLDTIIHSNRQAKFSIGWLGITVKQVSLAGATGENVLLVNYPNDGLLPFGEAMLLYVALHEAFHQLSMYYPKQPAWVAESLASYYGVRAVEIAMPNDPNSYALMQRFQKSGKHFKEGLLRINREVTAGDRSEYGAFYTKGLAFWMAVDKILQQTQGESLDHKLPAVLHTKYSANGSPIDLQKILGLSQTNWKLLRKRFLD